MGTTVTVALLALSLLIASGQSAQAQSAGRTVPLQDLGWAPGLEGGSGSVIYVAVNDRFQAFVRVQGLRPSHEYGVTVMGLAVDGTATADDSSFTLTTDAAGSGSTAIDFALPADAAPLPAYQVHILIVDRSEPLSEPLPNPLGVPFAVPLACEFPLGFLVGDPDSAAPVTDDTTINLENLGWAPGFDGGDGSFSWTPTGDSFEADVTATDLIPNHEYAVYVMAAALDGTVTLDSTSYKLTTDGQGAASVSVSLSPPTAGLPVPAFQVHILVVDETVTLNAPLPNPLGIPHPIALACESPAGFRSLATAAPAPPAPPATGNAGLADGGHGERLPWASWPVAGAGFAALVMLAGAAGVRMSTRRTNRGM
jgi:hypothetical protein